MYANYKDWTDGTLSEADLADLTLALARAETFLTHSPVYPLLRESFCGLQDEEFYKGMVVAIHQCLKMVQLAGALGTDPESVEGSLLTFLCLCHEQILGRRKAVREVGERLCDGGESGG